MSAPVDLRRTYGWRLCNHARKAAAERGVTVREVLSVVADHDVRYTAYDYGPGRFVYNRGELSIVVAEASRVVITVLWHNLDQWTSAQFRDHRAS